MGENLNLIYNESQGRQAKRSSSFSGYTTVPQIWRYAAVSDYKDVCTLDFGAT